MKVPPLAGPDAAVIGGAFVLVVSLHAVFPGVARM